MDIALKQIKDELDELLEIEESKRDYHKKVTNDTKSEFFYRGRIALMRHLLLKIERSEFGTKGYADISIQDIRGMAEEG